MDILAASYLLLFFVLTFALIAAGRIAEKMVMAERRRWVRLLVTVPQGIDHPFAEHGPHEIATSTELYKRLHELHIPFDLEVAVHAMGEEIHFYVAVPRMHMRATSRLIQSLWRTSSVAETDDYELWIDLPSNEDPHAALGYLGLARPYCVPLQTARKGHFEPFAGVLRHLANLAAVGEAGVIQWLARPADPRLIADVREHLQKFQKGDYHPSRHVHEHFILTPESLKALEAKAQSPLFRVNCRIATASAAGDAHELLRRFGNHFEASSVTDSQHNHFALVRPKKAEKAFAEFFTRTFDPAQTMIVTAEELATYFHLPGPRTASPKIRRK